MDAFKNTNKELLEKRHNLNNDDFFDIDDLNSLMVEASAPASTIDIGIEASKHVLLEKDVEGVIDAASFTPVDFQEKNDLVINDIAALNRVSANQPSADLFIQDENLVEVVTDLVEEKGNHIVDDIDSSIISNISKDDFEEFTQKPSSTNTTKKRSKPMSNQFSPNSSENSVSMVIIGEPEPLSLIERLVYGVLIMLIYGGIGVVVDIVSRLLVAIVANNVSSPPWLFTPMLALIGFIIGFISSQDGSDEVHNGIVYAIIAGIVLWFLFILNA